MVATYVYCGSRTAPCPVAMYAALNNRCEPEAWHQVNQATGDILTASGIICVDIRFPPTSGVREESASYMEIFNRYSFRKSTYNVILVSGHALDSWQL